MAAQIDVDLFRRYFAAMQPGWILKESAVGWILRVLLDEECPAYVVRETIDFDLRLAETPQELERMMLIQIARSWRAQVRYLIQAVPPPAKRCAVTGCIVHAFWHCLRCGLLLCVYHEDENRHTCQPVEER